MNQYVGSKLWRGHAKNLAPLFVELALPALNYARFPTYLIFNGPPDHSHVKIAYKRNDVTPNLT